MTKEECIADLKSINATGMECIDYAIKALEQQPCDDCVSRQAVIEYIEACGAELGHDIENESVREDILNMPSVTPKRKSGLHWIERFDNEDKWLECPHCHKDSDNAYCPNCGADMVKE